MTPPTRRRLRIAIIGGGLAGAAAAGALTRLPDVEVRVYERTEEVRELGALIAVMVSGVRVLQRMLSPPAFTELQRVLYRGEGTEGIHHRHWRSGEILASAVSPHTPRRLQEGRTGRVPLLRTLMMDVPDGVVELGREVVRVEVRRTKEGGGVQNGTNGTNGTANGTQDGAKNGTEAAAETEGKVDAAVLHFADGSTKEADLVVVADGLWSKIRRQYIPASVPTYKGAVAYRKNFPVELVAHIRGLPHDTSVYKRTDESVFLSALEPGTYSFVAFLAEPEAVADTMRWAHDLGRSGVERLKERLVGWHPLIHRVLDVMPDVDAYPLHAAPWMDSLVRDDCIAFVGDAAHPTAGAYGTGCAFAFCDVWALYRSLHRTHASRLPTHASPPPAVATASPYVAIEPAKTTNGSTDVQAEVEAGTGAGEEEVAYSVPYALRLYDETRRYFLKRVERQIGYDKKDIAYFGEAVDDYDEYVRRYRETFTVNWWLLEHDVDARFQEVEAEERHFYPGRKWGGGGDSSSSSGSAAVKVASKF